MTERSTWSGRALRTLMDDAARMLRARKTVIYTVRLIGQDDETFLTWARKPYACGIFNLHVVHTPQGIASATSLPGDV